MMYGFGGMGVVGGIVMLFVFVAVVVLVVSAVRGVMPFQQSGQGGVGETPLETLKHRYAAGEINQNEFDQARHVLDGRGA